MGKSDPILFPWYLDRLQRGHGSLSFDAVCFLGFPRDNDFSKQIVSSSARDFFDLSVSNWNINSSSWNIEKNKYDLIVCTRCAYFAEDPKSFITRCLELLKEDGILFVDWGMGDHWRFPQHRIGWIYDDTHEFMEVNGQRSHLHSCFWEPYFENHPTVIEFFEAIKRKNSSYRNSRLSQIVDIEFSAVANAQDHRLADWDFMFLWPDSPQLYILTIFQKSRES